MIYPALKPTPIHVCIFISLYDYNAVSAGVYKAQTGSSQKMMQVFGFASSLIEVLALGLQTFNRAHYRQLVKRIGHMIRLVH